MVDGVVEEDDGGEVGEAAEEGGGEWAGKVEVGEVKCGDGGVAWAAGDAGPVARGGVAVVPGGEGGVRVVKRLLPLVQIQTILVQPRNQRRLFQEEKKEDRKQLQHCFCV